MKHKSILLNLVLATAFFSIANTAMAYDSSWHKSMGWPGEYPPGFQVYKKGVKILGRTSVNKEETPTVECVLKRNRYAPGRALPAATYISMSKIVELPVKNDFVYITSDYNFETENFDEVRRSFKAGDFIEYLNYGAEGFFTVRFNGAEFTADQDLFNYVEVPMGTDEDGPFIEDLWVNLSCFNNVNVWLMFSDFDGGGHDQWIDGVQFYSHNPY